jgi:hypothetical protein
MPVTAVAILNLDFIASSLPFARADAGAHAARSNQVALRANLARFRSR